MSLLVKGFKKVINNKKISDYFKNNNEINKKQC